MQNDPYIYTYNLLDNEEKVILTLPVSKDTSTWEDRQYVLGEAAKRGLDISNANLSGGMFNDFDFSGLNLANANFYNTQFYGCKFNQTNLSNADLRAVYMNEACDTRGAILAGRYTPPEGAFSLWKVVGSMPREYSYMSSYRYRILRLEVPADARRIVAIGNPDRIRVSKAVPVELFKLNGKLIEEETFRVYPPQQGSAPYFKGELYIPDDFDDDKFKECSYGINGFDSRFEAQMYMRSTFGLQHALDE